MISKSRMRHCDFFVVADLAPNYFGWPNCSEDFFCSERSVPDIGGVVDPCGYMRAYGWGQGRRVGWLADSGDFSQKTVLHNYPRRWPKYCRIYQNGRFPLRRRFGTWECLRRRLSKITKPDNTQERCLEHRYTSL